MEVKKSPKVAKFFNCDNCHYTCSKESDFNKHLATRKHIGNNLEIAGNKKVALEITCNKCKKYYKTASGLWKHAKNCNVANIDIKKNHILHGTSSEITVLTNLVLEVVKSNSELQKQLIDVCKNSNTTNIIQTNSHNKTFNLQFFLNEQCKDAMNISDFANSFDLQLSDLESVGELGYVEGITKLMLDKLNSMDIYKRPIHCSDAKRETLYVKDDDKWEKEEKNNPKLRYAIKTISFRNMKLAGLWSDTYPDSKDGESYLNDKYMKLIKESTGGNGEITDSENKIIKRIAKELLIDKSK